jgi:STE24 endopeptidase
MEEDRAKRYNRLRRRVGYAKLTLGLGFLVFLLASGLSAALLREVASVAGSRWLQLVLYVAALGLAYQLISLPLDYWGGHVLEDNYGLTRQGPAAWLADHLKAAAIGSVLGLLLALLGYGLIWSYPDAWWYLGAAAFVLVALILATLAPVIILPLFYRFSPIEDEVLAGRLVSLAARAGSRVKGAYRWGLAEKTRKTNAALLGWGPTRRIIVADGLLESYSPEEIESVFAHELGHHVLRHLWKDLVVETAITFLAFFAVKRLFPVLAPWAGVESVADIAGLPLLALIFAGVSLLALPLTNAYSRHLEWQADEFALRLTREPGPFISAMRRLASDNLDEMEPSPVIEFLFYTHPSIARRIGLAERMMANPC